MGRQAAHLLYELSEVLLMLLSEDKGGCNKPLIISRVWIVLCDMRIVRLKAAIRLSERRV